MAAADRQGTLVVTDLERFAMAAYLSGRDVESVDVLTRAHAALLAAGQPSRAARAAFWLAYVFIHKGERARAGGWLERARRVLDDAGGEVVERGYLLIPQALQQVDRRDLASAEATFAEASRIGERFAEADLVNLARAGQGRALIAMGRTPAGVALLDEVMAVVTSGELSPVIAGTVYCVVISACFDMFDIRRAQEWTDALHDWCRSQSERIPYRGECRVRRAELMLLHGGWPEAREEAQQAISWLAQAPGHPAAGAASYQLGELHRLRGEEEEAEAAYRVAAEAGRSPYPGLALLRLAQGRGDQARAALHRVLSEGQERRVRARLLGAYVDVLLAEHDVVAARAAADEMAAIAGTLATPFVQAVAAYVDGAVKLAEGESHAALQRLRAASELWRELQAPYEDARTAVMLALACRSLGDQDGSELERRRAEATFTRLGAVPDLHRLEHLTHGETDAGPGGSLTARELEVLKLIAGGHSNRGIAVSLGISEKTVARHVSNIYIKLNLSSRSAATAHAFKHRLV